MAILVSGHWTLRTESPCQIPSIYHLEMIYLTFRKSFSKYVSVSSNLASVCWGSIGISLTILFCFVLSRFDNFVEYTSIVVEAFRFLHFPFWIINSELSKGFLTDWRCFEPARWPVSAATPSMMILKYKWNIIRFNKIAFKMELVLFKPNL